MAHRFYDICIVGGGILGSFVAKKCLKRFPDLKIGLIEAAPKLLTQTSSKNSGVLHTGIYYTPGSLKARLAVLGVPLMKEFCRDRKIEIVDKGKLVIPTSDQELQLIHKLYQNGLDNGVDVELVDKSRALEIEKSLNSGQFFDQALHAKDAAVTHISEINAAVTEDLLREAKFNKNFELVQNSKFRNFVSRGSSSFTFDTGATTKVQCGFLINCAGLDSLRIAQELNARNDLVQLGLKGFYLKAKLEDLENKGIPFPETLLYPAPPMGGSVFLGSHTTTTPDGYLKIGPNALPVTSQSLRFRGLVPESIFREIGHFGQLSASLAKNGKIGYYLDHLRTQASLLRKDNTLDYIKKIYDFGSISRARDCFRWEGAGIRTVLFDLERGEPETDFLVERGIRSVHLLNYSSPGWTCAIPMADLLLDEIELS